jgi:putative ABC transport system permease protein
MGVLSYKIFRDLWSNKGRTAQVVLIISIGAAAIGMIMGVRNLVVGGMQDIWRSMNPAMINFFVFPGLEQDELFALQKVSGVKDLEAFNNTNIEWRLSPDSEWQQGGLTARVDYEKQRYNILDLYSGAWPHGNTAAMTPDSHTVYNIPLSGEIEIRVNKRTYPLKIGGEVYDQLANPATFGGTAQFFVTQEHYEYLVGDKEYGRLLVVAPEYDEAKVTDLADRMDDLMQRMGHQSGRFITDPNKHFFQDQLDGIFYLMGVLGALALILGLLLVYNTINTIILSQVDQIGVMKAIGARTRQIIWLYFRLVLAYSVMALLVAMPLGIMGGWGLAQFLIGSFGADPGGFDVDQQAAIMMALIAIVAPLLASLVPIIMASRTTVREAISTYGLSTKAGLLDKIIAKMRFLTRLTILTISNTFRHKARVSLLQIALVLSGLVFMMVVGVRDAVVYTVKDVMFQILGANVTMMFEDFERIDHVEEMTMQYPGVKAIESWGLANVTGRKQGQKFSDDDDSILMFGVPLPTQVYGYMLLEGRWLTPEDQNALVMNSKLARDMEVGVGDWITIRYAEKNERDFQVVGLTMDPIMTTSVLAPRDLMLRDLGQVGRTVAVWIKTEQSGPDYENAFAKDLRKFYEANGVQVSSQRGVFGMSESSSQTANTIIGQFNFLIVLLGVMAVVIGAVGSIALGGALALSVMERRREIGVMRAIGASSWAIFRMFIGEGLILGWLSWLIAFPLAIPASKVMVYALGQAFNIDILYNYTVAGPVMWLVIITILSVVASVFPARGATRISVRESLAYQ